MFGVHVSILAVDQDKSRGLEQGGRASWPRLHVTGKTEEQVIDLDEQVIHLSLLTPIADFLLISRYYL